MIGGTVVEKIKEFIEEKDYECNSKTYKNKDREHLTVFVDKTTALEIIRELVVQMQRKHETEFQFSLFGIKR